MLEFDPKLTETDNKWSPSERETMKNIAVRVDCFLQFLSQRPETWIVVVSHGVWIETCFRIHCPEALGDRRVYNCDMFAGECVSVGGTFVRLQKIKKLN
jgi:broad specificity phosphatase PhoE